MIEFGLLLLSLSLISRWIEGGCLVVFILPLFISCVFPLHHHRCYHRSIVLCSHPSVLMSCPLSRFTPNTTSSRVTKPKPENTQPITPLNFFVTHTLRPACVISIQSHLSVPHKPVARTSHHSFLLSPTASKKFSVAHGLFCLQPLMDSSNTLTSAIEGASSKWSLLTC